MRLYPLQVAYCPSPRLQSKYENQESNSRISPSMITFDSRILRRAKRSLLQIYLIKKQERKFKNANFKLFSEVSMFERNLEELIKFRGIDNSGVDNYG